MYCKILWGVFFAFTATTTASEGKGWELIRQSQHSVLYQRTVAGTQVKELKAKVMVAAPPHAILGLLKDTAVYADWVEHGESVKEFKRLSATENLVYTRLTAPWPVKKRDLVTYSRYWQDENNCTLFIQIQASPSSYPKAKDYIRIIDAMGLWIAQPKSKTKTLISYQGFFEPGGALPAALTNMVAKDGLLQTFENMKQRLDSGKYHQASFAQVNNQCHVTQPY